MSSNLYSDIVHIQQRSTTITATGETVYWKPVETRHARVIPASERTIERYQQNDVEVTHRILMRDSVTVTVGDYRFKHGNKTYEPVAPARDVNTRTEILVREI